MCVCVCVKEGRCSRKEGLSLPLPIFFSSHLHFLALSGPSSLIYLPCLLVFPLIVSNYPCCLSQLPSWTPARMWPTLL